MTNEEFRQSLSKEQLRFLQDKYKKSLNQVEDSFDGASDMYYGEYLEFIGNRLLVASVYKGLLVDDSLNSLYDEYHDRYKEAWD